MTSSIVERFEQAVRPGASLTILETAHNSEVSMLFDELIERAHRGAAGLARAGVGAGDVVAVFAETSPAFFVGCLSAWNAGAGLLPLPARSPFESATSWEEKSARILTVARAKLVLASEGATLPRLTTPVVDIASLGGTTTPQPGTEATDTALLLSTSGSVGASKLVSWSWQSLDRRIDSIVQEFPDVADDDHFLNWLPLGYSAGLQNGLLRPLKLGVSCSIMSTRSFSARPARWLGEISRRRVTHAGGPHFAFVATANAIRKGLDDDIDLSAWRFAFSSGEPIEVNGAKAFLETAGPLGFSPEAFTVRYAMTETGVLSVSHGLRVDRASLDGGSATPASAPEGAEIASVGRPLPDVDLRVVDEHGAALPDRRIGEVCVRSDRMAEGYTTEDGTHRLTEDEWFRTGDVGYTAGGELYLSGRSTNRIIVRGRTYLAEDIERALAGVRDVEPNSACALGISEDGRERLFVIAECQRVGASQECEKEIRDRLWKRGLVPDAILLTTPGALPRTDSGKLRRGAIRRAYETGTLTPLV